jgi:hypothetical protein
MVQTPETLVLVRVMGVVAPLTVTLTVGVTEGSLEAICAVAVEMETTLANAVMTAAAVKVWMDFMLLLKEWMGTVDVVDESK